MYYAGPDPFPPMFNEEAPFTVNITSTNPEWSPVLRTGIIVYDNTGDIIQNEFIPSNNVCLSFEAFPQNCAPFTVYATAYTHCSESSTSMYKSKL